MFLVELGRLAGVVIFVFAAFFLYGFAKREELAPAVTSGAVATGGFLFMLFCHRALNRRKAAKEAAIQAEGENFRGGDLTVGFRWLRGAVLFFFMSLFAVGSAWAMVAMWGKGQPLIVFATALLAALLGMGALSFLLTMFAASRAGHLLRMDALGFAHCALPVIAWRDIRGIHLQTREHKGNKYHDLLIALDRAAFDALRPSALRRWLHWTAPRFHSRTHIVAIGCNAMDKDPVFVGKAATAIADRAGSRRVKHWFFPEPIEVAIERHEAELRADEALQELERLPARAKRAAEADDVADMEAINARMKTLTQDMDKAQQLRLAALEAHAGRARKAARQMMWIGVISIVFFLAWVALKFAR